MFFWPCIILITNLMHQLLFIHKIIFSSTSFEAQVLIFRRIQLYTCSVWYCHSLWEFLVACRYTASVRTDCRGRCLKTPKCNRLLRLGRPVGAVTLSRWEWWWNERWIWGARGALNLISTIYPDHGHHGRLPLSHGRTGNRTRDPMVSSQELRPPSHEAGLV